MKSSKRYLITIVAGIVLAVLAILSAFKEMEGLASVCVGGILTILTTYIWGETKRPSKTNEP
jgi:drug/metabolite transporter superfamily protein YnfA